jgi:hypothetical protein
MRALGLSVDPNLAQYGRGGAMAGWPERKAVVDQIRQRYLAVHGGDEHNIDAVPIDWINAQLEREGVDWRARVVDDQYEFHLPGR